ncbi:hypothetical protein F4818DRAFT_119851 [Hypoxylon cercidicola]|nr:hypothetical protein F4818DRAFT_119851 [Hypoxylon cercidicola]
MYEPGAAMQGVGLARRVGQDFLISHFQERPEGEGRPMRKFEHFRQVVVLIQHVLPSHRTSSLYPGGRIGEYQRREEDNLYKCLCQYRVYTCFFCFYLFTYRKSVDTKLYSPFRAMEDVGLQPTDGLPLGIFSTSIIFAIFSTSVVLIRVYVRWADRAFWWDDWMMVIGLILFLCEAALSCICTHFGLAVLNTGMTERTAAEGRKYLIIWTLFYIASLNIVKSSICMTMLRLTQTMRTFRLIIFALLALTIASFFMVFVSTVAICQPMDGNWNKSYIEQGRVVCASDQIRMGVSYASTVLTIITDIGCAVLPALIVWKTQLDLKTKLMVCVLLSFGSFASVCTMIRAPYIKYYVSEDLLYWQGYVVLWSNVETTIGLIAGSVPVLQKLIMGHFKKQGSHVTPLDIITIGSMPPKSRNHRDAFLNPTDTGFSVASVHASRRSREWERLDDSSPQGIRADYTYEVELSQIQESESGDSKA